MISNHMFDLFHLNESVSEQLHGESGVVNLPFSVLLDHDSEYAERVLTNPLEEIAILSKAASGFTDGDVTVCIVNLPYTTPIHKLRSEYNYLLLQVEGTVVLRSGLLSRPRVLTYKCPVCGCNNIEVVQDEQWLKKPEQCNNCDNRKGFIKNYEETKFDDYQWLQIQELNENTPDSRSPQKIKVLLKNNHVETCEVGDTVKLSVIPKIIEQSQKSSNLELKTYLECVGVINQSGKRKSRVTEEQKQKFHELVKTENFIETLIDSTAPTLYGLREEKLFMCLQQVGGVEKNIDGEYKRGSIHGWFPGDPSEGKSVALNWAARMSQKGIIASGGGASAVGLTASVRHDKELGEWVLEPGALVLADNGHVSIDEIEKMRDDDREAIHPAMEQQRVYINKAGINANLLTRCSVLGASNPSMGKWNKYADIGSNIENLPHALQTRFDCIFLFINDREWDEEESRVEHVLSIHGNNGHTNKIIDEESLKLLFSYARLFKPVLTTEASERIKEIYKTLFNAGRAKNDETIMITIRLLEGAVRLSEASAKLHLRDEVIVDDVELAFRVLKASLFSSLLDNETGGVDVSQLYKDSGKPRSKKDRVLAVENLIKGYVEVNNCKGIPESKLYSSLNKAGVKSFEAQSLILGMERNNVVYRDGDTICIF